jgi:hypothetical protein
MSELFCLDYVVEAHEEIQIVLGQFREILVDRVVDGIIHYRVRTLVSFEPPLREMTCDPLSIGNFWYSYEYEAPKVTMILSREAFILHRLLGYIDDDRDIRFPGIV